MRSIVRGFAVLALTLLVAASALAAKKTASTRSVDRIWVVPEFAAHGVRSIAMLPPTSYDHSLESENLAAALWGQALKDAGYRWVSANTARTLIQAQLGDSAVKSAQAVVLTTGRVDSLAAPALAKATRASALLSLRVDRLEKMEIEWNQAGRPSTSVQLTAALVDSTGRLLWSAAGSETAEGPYHDPNASSIGVSGSDLGNKPITGQGGAPAFAEVLTKLFTRWAGQFPTAGGAAPDSAR